MASGREHTPYQQKAIRAYYQNRDAIRAQSLADLVSDLFLATAPKKQAALWARARDLLVGTGLPAAEADAIVSARDVERLARVAARGFEGGRPAEWKRDARDDRRT